MKRLTTISAVFASATLHALPIHWDVELTAQPPQVFTLQRPRGETYALEAVLKDHGKPFEPAITNACIYWQTNGMENLYWSAPASVSNNVLLASWLPSMDPGATTVRGYIGDPGHIYAAAFQFRFIASPGATPNELPLPQKVIDFAKVTVLNPPWSGGGGGGGGVDTNALIDIIHKTVDGSARTLPPYLHYMEMDDTYPDAAAEWYAQADYSHGSCSSVRDGGFLYRNFDCNFDFMPEFVVRCVATASSPSCPSGRFASLAVCNVGTNLTEADVVSGKWSRWYKALPGHAVDGINENGVACNINVVDGPPQWGGGISPALHPLAAVRWILDNATNAQQAATYIASHIRFPNGWTQNFHYMIADETATYIVENGTATNGDEYHEPDEPVTMTNFQLSKFPWGGMGMERFGLLLGGANITNAWYTRCYRRETNPPWVTDLADVLAYTNEIFDAWATHPKEYFRNSSLIPHTSSLTWLQTVHTSIYNITNRVLRVAVQEVDDWYTFTVPAASSPRGVDESAVREIIQPMIGSATNALDAAKRDKVDRAVYSVTRTENTDWTWTSDNKELEAALNNGVKLEYSENSQTWAPQHEPDGYWSEPKLGSKEELSVSIVFHDNDTDEQSAATATRPRYMDETLGPAKDDQKLAAVATDDAAKPADGSIMKYDAANDRFVKATAGVDYIKTHQDISGKLDNAGGNINVSGGALRVEPELGRGIFAVAIGSFDSWSSYTAEGQNLPDYLDSLGWLATGNRTLAQYGITDAAPLTMISAADPTFTNAVLQTVIPGLSTNITAEVYIAATNACANLGIDPALIPQGGTLGTVGGLLVALAAAVALLRKKTKLLKSDGTAEDDFATDLLGKQVAISAMRYGLASTSATVKAADRTVTKVTLGTTAVTVTFPDADENGKTRDFLLRIDAANLATGGSLTITKPTGAVIYGDAFPSPEATKQYLVAITETAANEFYVRTIEITIPTEA